MTRTEAVTILGQACMQVKANWQEHQLLQEALKVVAGEQKVAEVEDASTRG